MRLLHPPLFLSRLLGSLLLLRLLHSPQPRSRFLRSPQLLSPFLSCSFSSLCSKTGGFSLVSSSYSVSCLVSFSFSCSLSSSSFPSSSSHSAHLIPCVSFPSGTDMAWGCEPPAPMLGAPRHRCPSWSSSPSASSRPTSSHLLCGSPEFHPSPSSRPAVFLCFQLLLLCLHVHPVLCYPFLCLSCWSRPPDTSHLSLGRGLNFLVRTSANLPVTSRSSVLSALVSFN